MLSRFGELQSIRKCDMQLIDHYNSSVPHVLSSSKLVDDARDQDEEVLHEERHSRVGDSRLEVLVGLVNIFSKQNITTS